MKVDQKQIVVVVVVDQMNFDQMLQIYFGFEEKRMRIEVLELVDRMLIV